MFEIILYSLVAIGWGAFGYHAIQSTYYENRAWAECKDTVFKNDKSTKYLQSIHYYIAASWSTEFNQLLVGTFKICTHDKCVIENDKYILPTHAYFASKKNTLTLELPKLKPGTYSYKVTTDVEGYRVLHAEKICHFTIKD